MASPPFSIAETTPADDSFANVYPAAERTFRDVVESWLLIEGNTNGRSNKRIFDYQGATPSGTASANTVYADTLGYMRQRFGTDAVQYLGVPPGTILITAGSSADDGYLFCDGSAVSRTTYARLFARISTTYGAGNGSTTFNLPDLRGRYIAFTDAGSGRMTQLSGNLGATGGADTKTITQSFLPSYDLSIALNLTSDGVTTNPSANVNESQHRHDLFVGSFSVQAGGSFTVYGPGSSTLLQTEHETTGITVDVSVPATVTNRAVTGSVNLNGNGNPLPIVPQTIIFNGQIKY